MKRFITYVSHQISYNTLEYDASSCLLDMKFYATHLPILPLMNAVVENGETIEVILIATEGRQDKIDSNVKQAFDRNLEITKKEIIEWAKTKNVTLKGINEPITGEESANMTHMLRVFAKLIARVEKDYCKEDLFYGDLTFGTKPMSIVLFSALRYIHAIRRNPVEIVYGQVYRYTKDGKDGKPVTVWEGEMQELSALFYMDSLISKVGEMDLPNPQAFIQWSLESAIGEEGGESNVQT